MARVVWVVEVPWDECYARAYDQETDALRRADHLRFYGGAGDVRVVAYVPRKPRAKRRAK